MRYKLAMGSTVTMPGSTRAVLAALARGALADDYVVEVPERMSAAILALASDTERSQFIGVLRALDTRAGALALTGKPVPVSWLSPSEAEAMLQ